MSYVSFHDRGYALSSAYLVLILFEQFLISKLRLVLREFGIVRCQCVIDLFRVVFTGEISLCYLPCLGYNLSGIAHVLIPIQDPYEFIQGTTGLSLGLLLRFVIWGFRIEHIFCTSCIF